MQNVSIFVFLPLTICLLVLSFNEKLRKRVLALRIIRAAEEKLGGFNRLYWPAFILIMAAGVFARCYRFVELPMGINQDGLMAGNEGYSLLMNGTDQFGMAWPTYFQAWGFSQMSTLYSYLLIPFFKFLGVSKFTLRLPMLLASIAMLPVIWDFARRMAGKNYALLALFVAATCPWHIIQSRWALEANLMPHVLLTGMYLLFLGRERRWTLYLSMVFFGLTPYAYGVACFSVPVFLLFAAIYYAARKKVRIVDLLICVALFICVGGPYFYTMAINAFGLETAHLGPITMPLFEDSLRSNDMAFTQESPYYTMLWNFLKHLDTWLLCGEEALYSVIGWTHALYRFMPPVALCGMYIMWKKRRAVAGNGLDNGFRDGGMLLLLWMLAAMFNGAMIGGVINRNNVVFYPLLFFMAYALYWMGKRFRTGLAAVVSMIFISFVGLNVTYFTDKSYQKTVADMSSYGLYEALLDTRDWDYDRYYVQISGEDEGAHAKLMNAFVMFAHQIDYRGRNDDMLLKDSSGQEIDWYYSERYDFVDFDQFELDPMECAVYISAEGGRNKFNPDEYLITEYGNYIAAYPVYWAE